MVQKEKHTKRLTAVFYSNAQNVEPVRAWLKALPANERKKIGIAIAIVEFGWPIGMPVCRSLGEGLYEVRVALDRKIARVLFSINDGEMFLLHGLIKKTQRLPQADLALAKKRMKEE